MSRPLMNTPAVEPPTHRLQCVLVMPAYNEEGCIQKVVEAWMTKMRAWFGQETRCIVVNDGSRDRTGELLDALAAQDPQVLVIHQKNAGHGGALLNAYRQALALNPEFVFHVDSDDQFDPDDFDALWQRRAESPFVLGYRAGRQDAFHRLVITRILHVVLTLSFGLNIRDSNVPFRLMTAGFLRQALAIIPGQVFAPNIFLSVIAARQGCDLMHLPVRHVERKTGKVSIVRWKLLKVCWRCVGEVTAFRRQLASLGRAGRSA